MKLATVLFVLAVGCGGPKGGGPTNPEPVAGTSKAFELTFQTFASAGTGQRPVDQGATLKSGDKIALSVSVTRPAYLYVLQFFPDGTAEVLFPGPGEERPLEGTQRVPGTGWFQLDDAVGEENVYIVASAEPLVQADAAIRKTVDTVRTTRKAPPEEATTGDPANTVHGDTDPGPKQVDPTQQVDPTSKPDGTSDPARAKGILRKEPVRVATVGGGARPGPGGISLRERGLKRVEAGSTIRATADESGVAVFRFAFNHAAN